MVKVGHAGIANSPPRATDGLKTCYPAADQGEEIPERRRCYKLPRSVECGIEYYVHAARS